MGFVGRAPPPPPLLGFLSNAVRGVFRSSLSLLPSSGYANIKVDWSVTIFFKYGRFNVSVIWQVVRYDNSNHGILSPVQIRLLVLFTRNKINFAISSKYVALFNSEQQTWY